mmetsp:Transcript_426/g.1183  ORF Transcript_426/g.1183 Transcript_426/m.1183 type:complete len:296 (-) Transcript_426:435-1322(-)
MPALACSDAFSSCSLSTAAVWLVADSVNVSTRSVSNRFSAVSLATSSACRELRPPCAAICCACLSISACIVSQRWFASANSRRSEARRSSWLRCSACARCIRRSILRTRKRPRTLETFRSSSSRCSLWLSARRRCAPISSSASAVFIASFSRTRSFACAVASCSDTSCRSRRISASRSLTFASSASRSASLRWAVLAAASASQTAALACRWPWAFFSSSSSERSDCSRPRVRFSSDSSSFFSSAQTLAWPSKPAAKLFRSSYLIVASCSSIRSCASASFRFSSAACSSTTSTVNC